MSNRLRFHPLLVEDLQQATGWYDGISLDLGNRFRMQVNARLDQIAERPRFFGFIFDDFRVALIQQFPYLVLYREASEEVHIVGIFHSASDPEKWQKRATES